MGYKVQEKLKKGVRWRTCHIHSYGDNAPKSVATKFQKEMREAYGKQYTYRIQKNK